MTDLTLVYFKMRALAEAPQMMLRHRDHPYRYVMGWDYFGKPWAEASQRPLPAAADAGDRGRHRITQTGAIMRYLSGST